MVGRLTSRLYPPVAAFLPASSFSCRSPSRLAVMAVLSALNNAWQYASRNCTPFHNGSNASSSSKLRSLSLSFSFFSRGISERETPIHYATSSSINETTVSKGDFRSSGRGGGVPVGFPSGIRTLHPFYPARSCLLIYSNRRWNFSAFQRWSIWRWSTRST